jgi:hypothetical protein
MIKAVGNLLKLMVWSYSGSNYLEKIIIHGLNSLLCCINMQINSLFILPSHTFYKILKEWTSFVILGAT